MSSLTPLSFARDWLPKLVGALRRVRKARAAELARIGNQFGDALLLAKHYVEPDCQHNNPAGDDRDIDSVVRANAFETIRLHFERCSTQIHADGRRHLFVLADAGMGKTSLLVMLKLMHLEAFWPRGYKCALIKLGREADREIAALEDHARTVLLLDSLDEDPVAWGDVEGRIAAILDATKNFLSVIITCRTQYFPTSPTSPERPGGVEVAGYRCPSIYLSPLSDAQVETYLRKRFPRTFWRWLSRKDDPNHRGARAVLAKLDTLQMRPMLLAYIDDLLELRKAKGDLGAYQAFFTLVDRWLWREERRARNLNKDLLWVACTTVARRMDEKGERLLSTDELFELAQIDPTVAKIQLLDLGGRALLNRTSDGAYRFAHFSLQEFLLAHHVLTRRESDALSVQGTTQLGRFLEDGANLYGRRHGGLDSLSDAIRGVAFRQAVFSDVDFSGMQFDHCGFVGASLADACLSNVVLSDVDLRGADLRRADLRSLHAPSGYAAILDGANLSEADLSGAELRGASMKDVKLDGARYDQDTTWPPGFEPDRLGARRAIAAAKPRAPSLPGTGESIADVRNK